MLIAKINHGGFWSRQKLKFQPKKKDESGRWNRGNIKNFSVDQDKVKLSKNRSHCLSCLSCRRQLLLSLASGYLPSEANGVVPSSEFDLWSASHSEWGQKFFAQAMATTMGTYENQVSSIKQDLFSSIVNSPKDLEIMELGFGTGPNLQYYARTGIHVSGLEPNKEMRKFAFENAKRANLDLNQLDFISGVAESLPLPSNSFDFVIGTLVLCSVKDVQLSVSEVMRVLKPGGKYIFLEHVAAPSGTLKLNLQNLFDPLQQALADGCHLTRNPLPYLQSVGFESIDSQLLEISSLGLLSPHLGGVAVKSP